MTALFVSVFLISSLVGFGLGREAKAVGSTQTKLVAPANQLNIVLVRVDDAAKASPQLVSVWGFFISRSAYPSVIMKRLYPEAGSETAAVLGKTFALDAKKQPAGKFLDSLNNLGLPGMKIAVADNKLAVDWLNGLAEQALPQTAGLASLPDDPAGAQTADQQAFSNACTAIEKHSSGVLLVSSAAQEKVKVGSDLEFSDAFSGWKGLVTSLHLSSCNMLVGP